MEVCTASTTDSFASRALHFHRFVRRRLLAGILGRRGEAATVAAATPPPRARRIGENGLVVDVDALLLKPSSPSALFSPYFLVAVEAGGYARGLALLALYPALRALPHGARVRAMAMVAFCGLRRDEAARIGRAVLPRHFFRAAADARALEAVGALPERVKVAAVTRSFPAIMVEAFLTQYVGFDVVVGAEEKGGARYLVGSKPRGSARITIAGDAQRTQRTHVNTVEHTNERGRVFTAGHRSLFGL